MGLINRKTVVVTVHIEGIVQLTFVENGVEIGTRQLSYCSLTGSVMTGLSQIYLEQLHSLLRAILMDDLSPSQSQSCDNLLSPTNFSSWDSARVDRIMAGSLFSEDSLEHIPLQAFEQIFGVYNHTDIGW